VLVLRRLLDRLEGHWLAAVVASAGPTPWVSWPAAAWRVATSPRAVGPPQLTVLVDLDSLTTGPGRLGSDTPVRPSGSGDVSAAGL